VRCKSCDYRLWNLRSRTCPECGTGFVPSDYEFTPNSVQFVCPHCDQSYYGTSADGHLVPVEFACVHCGRHVHMDEMIVLPTAGVQEEQTGPEPMPWLDRRKHGVGRGWILSVGRAMVRPGRLIESVPVESSLPAAWWFTIMVHLPVFLVAAIPLLILPRWIGRGGPSLGAPYVVIVLFGTFAPALAILIWGAVVHGLLWLLAEPAAGLRRTYQALCYSAGANVVMAFPCLGIYFGWIWWLVSAVIMVKAGQKVSGWRAAVSVLLLPVLAFVSVVVLYIYFITVVLSTLPGSLPDVPADSREQTQMVLDSVLTYGRLHDGKGPDHSILLVFYGDLSADGLLATESLTLEDDVPVGDMTLDQFEKLAPPDRWTVVKAAIDALPSGTAAHRLGDFVFTYHGVDLDECDSRLWVVVMAFDPELNDVPSDDGLIYVGLADQSVLKIPTEKLAAKLAVQNELRQALNLPLLPDPTQVRHVRPTGE